MRTSLTIFGGTGDLTYRKLLPALYNLSVSNKNHSVDIVIIGRRDYTDDQYINIIRPWVSQYARFPFTTEDFESFSSKIHYFMMDITDSLQYKQLNHYYMKHQLHNHVFYFAVAPRFFKDIANGLTLVETDSSPCVVIEKPFGEDLASAKVLNQYLEHSFGKDNVFHIDHYLGKEMVRNILTLRFTNPIFSTVWNSKYIESIQINAFETVGVETRGDYYDKSGALSDMVQNHLLQILSIVAMEPMDTMTADSLHQHQLQVLKQMRDVSLYKINQTVCLGQYDGYRSEDKVNPSSQTETFAALKLFIDNPRWEGMPFYIRTGKKMDKREMEVVVTFKQNSPYGKANVLIIKIQPTEGVYLQFNIKQPGNSEKVIPTHMDFCQSCNDVFRINTPQAYERLLMMIFDNDTSLFARWDIIEWCWNYVDKLKYQITQANLPLHIYAKGSTGPIDLS